MKKKIGLALGSGSARGLAHIGVFKALQEAKIELTAISGTSIGSLMGAAFASGNLDAMEKFMRQIDLKKMASYCDFTFPRQALMEGDKIMELIEMLVPVKQFQELEIPLQTVSCDIHTGESIIFDDGDLHKAIRSSISLPGIFLPVYHEGRWLVDGGLVDPVPVGVLRKKGVDVIIAVDLNHDVLDVNGKKKGKQESEKKKKNSEPTKLIEEAIAESKKSNWIVDALGGGFREMEKSMKETLSRWANDDQKKKPEGPSIFDAIAFSIDIMSYQITKRNFESEPADYTIEPAVGHLGLFDYEEAIPSIDDGYARTVKLIEKMKSDGVFK